ncbi:MAG: hypothetical protein AABX11_03810 [Nanoarchaeota archaeon]
MEITKKHIYAIDFAIIVGTLIVLFTLVIYMRPMVISPLDNLETTNNSMLFSFEKGNIIYLDDNIEFTSPEKISAENNLIINLKPGVYYWKVEGVVKSETRTLTIKSEIDLRLREAGEFYEVVNSGNTRLKVDIYNNNTLVGNVILESDESANVSGTKFVGAQDE